MNPINLTPETAPVLLCEYCHFECSRPSDWNRHLLTRKHKIRVNPISFTQKKTPSNVCKNCDFECGKKSDWMRHLNTEKHKLLENLHSTHVTHENGYLCVCSKSYKHISSLYTHKKTCNFIAAVPQQNDLSALTNLVIEVMKTNTELQKQMFDLCKSSTTNNNNIQSNSNNMSNNKTFNLQFFLNETCKNAMNMVDFVQTLEVQLADLESVGEMGFVNGIANLIIKNLNALEECERPVHCSDLKRETIYVKEDNKWEKEGADNLMMKKAIQQIVFKNTKMLPTWKKKYPECSQSTSVRSDQYSYMVIEAMGGSGDNDEEKANKIVSKIAKEILIRK